MNEYIVNIFNVTIIISILRYMTPILLSSIGGLMSDISGVLNIGLEGLMLIGAFFAIMSNALTESWIIGILVAVIVCVVVSMTMGYCSMKLKVDILVAGFAVNVLGSGITILLMKKILNVTGNYLPNNLNNIPTINLPIIKNIYLLDQLFNGHSLMVWVSVIAIILCFIILYYTPYGIHIRATGENPEATEANGISVTFMRYTALMWAGAFCGLAGAYLSTGITSMFVRDMTGGMGFLSLAVVFFANKNPKLILVGSIFFGLISTVSTLIQITPDSKIPSQFIEVIPYIGTIMSLLVVAIRKKYKSKLRFN